MFARWGGEEFVIIFQNVSEDVLCSIAERIRKHVEDAEFSSVGKLTISIGATMATGQDTANSLFARVDKALYAAKQTGRNQVCFQ